MLPSISVRSYLLPRYGQRHHAPRRAGRLASWPVALLTIAFMKILERNIVCSRPSGIPSYFEVPPDPLMSGWSSSCRCLIVTVMNQAKSNSTTRIFGGSGSYLLLPPYFQRMYTSFNVLDVIRVEGDNDMFISAR